MEPRNGDRWKPRKQKKRNRTIAGDNTSILSHQEGKDDEARPSPFVLSESLPPDEGQAVDVVLPEHDEPPVAEPEPETSQEEQPARRSRAPQKDREEENSTPIDYMPIPLFIAMTLFSLGIYPYIWLLKRVDGFSAAGMNGLDRMGIVRYCVVGLGVQLLPWGAIMAFVWSRWDGGDFALRVALQMMIAYAAAFALVVLPYRCFYHFDIRWRLRRAASVWDTGGIMIARTMGSLPRLFLLGTPYIQHHINRLIGLGMPGFSGYDDMPGDFYISDVIRDYVRGGHGRE